MWIPEVSSVYARITFLSLNILSTDNLAVPIPIVDPTDIVGIVETNISVTIPAEVIAGVSKINLVFSDETPITCCPVNFETNVDTPEITIVSLSNNLWVSFVWIDNSPVLFQIIDAFWCPSLCVSIFSIVIPLIESTNALIPPPFVSVLSNFKISPTLYPSPDSCISNPLTDPLVTESIVDDLRKISFGSFMKSLSEPTSATAYGKVFLSKSELLKSKSWFVFWSNNLDL